MLRMGEVESIRRQVVSQGKGIREAARALGYSRNTVRKYVRDGELARHEPAARAKPVTARVGPRIDALLAEWRGRTTAKQRVTATRVHGQLREEGFAVGITTVRDYLREKRRAAAEVFIPLVHRPGDEAQVDFFEVTVEAGGQVRKAWKFLVGNVRTRQRFHACIRDSAVRKRDRTH